MASKNTILLCYPRSGGTLFSRVLASLPKVTLISEVNPHLNAAGSIADQAKEWYGMDVREDSFQSMATSLVKESRKKEHHLIIRDFSFIDFTPHALNNFQPVGHFSILKELNGKDFKPIAFVRDVYDVWISRGCPKAFSEFYLNYVKALKSLNIPIVKYEDFCDRPEETLKDLCSYLEITYDETAIAHFSRYSNVTGDIKMRNSSRGTFFEMVKKLPRKWIPRYLQTRASNDVYLKEANRLFNYPDDFGLEEKPGFLERTISTSKWRLKEILKRSVKF